MQENVGFLQDVRGDIIDELRLSEGMIFRDEKAKILFLDIKYFVLDALQTKWRIMDREAYEEELSDIILWSAKREEEECARSKQEYPGIAERLTEVTMLYAKYLFVKQSSADKKIDISIKKPKVGTLLRGMFTRLCRMHQIRNGSFFDLTPMNQDFVLRDIFRHTLSAECMQLMDNDDDNKEEHESEKEALSIVTEKSSITKNDHVPIKEKLEDDSKSVIKSVVPSAKSVVDVTALQQSEEQKQQKEQWQSNHDDKLSTLTRSSFLLKTDLSTPQKPIIKANADVQEELEDEDEDEDVYPNDSISVRGSQYISTFPLKNKPKGDAKPSTESMSMYTRISNSAPSSAASSQFRKPKIVHLEEGFST